MKALHEPNGAKLKITVLFYGASPAMLLRGTRQTRKDSRISTNNFCF